MRTLSYSERTLIARLADKLESPKREQLLADLAQAVAVSLAGDGALIKFEIADYQRPPYSGQHLYGAEGTVLDSDGADLTILLYADENDRLLELEIIRWDSKELIGPKWETLNII
jgi:hypothetical protein